MMLISIANKLLNIANALDENGLYAEANMLTNMVKVAQMPGQAGWTPQSAVATVPQPVPALPPINNSGTPPANNPVYTPSYTQPNWSAVNPATSPTVYSGPQTPNQWGNQPRVNNNPIWYNNQQYNANAQQLQQQLLNTPLNPMVAVRTGPDGKQIVERGQTMQQLINQTLPQIQNNNAEQTVQNARQMQIDREMQEAQTRYWQLWQESQKQWAGDGNFN